MTSKVNHLSLLLLLGVLLSSHGWVSPPKTVLRHQQTVLAPSPSKLNGVFDFMSPFESKIPEELRDEIYQAEANTPAAKDRGQRVAIYALIAFVGILCAFFNGFLTELRANGPDGSPGVDLVDAGFGWVTDNFFLSFLFTNKIGGGICLLGGAGAGLLAEAELDTKRINAEKIYEELERRRNAKTKPTKKKKISAGKKRRSGKEKKRLTALSEVILEDNNKPAETIETEEVVPEDDFPVEEEEKKNDEKGLLGGLKDLYDKADTMAASQALLLNKSLEDAGVVEKITDETGLKVVGKEAAAKLKEESAETDKQDSSKENKN